MQKVVRWTCGVCGRGVVIIQYCLLVVRSGVHRKCSGIKGSMFKMMETFVEVA